MYVCRFAENLKEMHGIKKNHVKGVQNFCFCQLSMLILWRRRCSRVVDLKLPIAGSMTVDTDGTFDLLHSLALRTSNLYGSLRFSLLFVQGKIDGRCCRCSFCPPSKCCEQIRALSLSSFSVLLRIRWTYCFG